MAKLSSAFSSLPKNAATERRIFRSARTGQIHRPGQPNTGDAFRVVSAVASYRNAYVDNQTTIDFFGVLSRSWAARKDWRP